MKKIKVIDLLNKIANGELEEHTKFYDKCTHKTYIYKPKIYSGIYPENKACANNNWYLTLQVGSSRLLDEVEIIEDIPEEEKKKIEEAKKFIDNILPILTNIKEQLDKVNGE